jgi:nickel-type superoxide dismutase maturation protease
MLRRLTALLPIVRYEVEGASMAPSFVAGERLLINKAAYWFGRSPRAGDVVVARDPREPERLILKRIAGEHVGGWRVEGDNAAASTDSREFGAVSRDLIVGKVVGRY